MSGEDVSGRDPDGAGAVEGPHGAQYGPGGQDGHGRGGGPGGRGGGGRTPEPVGEGPDFTAEQVARGRALRRQVLPLSLASAAASLALPLALGLTSGGARLVGAFGTGWAPRVVGAAVTLVVLGEAVGLPFAARGRVVRVRYGLVTQGWGGWAVDRVRGLAVSLPLALGALFAVYALAGVTGRWWVWAALGAAALAVLLSFLAPLVLEPLFNRFTPMEPGPLRTDLLALAARDGVAVRDVLVADASRRTTALNAYVSGLGRTRRIVVHDTLLATADPREVELVVAHELGHVVHHDVARGTLLGALGAAAGVCVLAAVVTWEPLLHAAGVRHFADPRSAWLLAAAAAVGGALAGPLTAVLSRRIERRADQHALDTTGDPATFIAMQRRLTVANVADPAPPRVAHALLGSHPTAAERIAAARAWAAAG
ncbi:putative peptidase [Actinacidiphila reveromycinica]|uniref:Putative peptidase n=1 Tax=Actinacidiphila reveromycinica TaxID=659352 RepID=A0A7U3UQF0_9ACTN|nr:M48 family metalloprotease [Streptomyces sp. SN-593]BBA96818.1 putative peptidase [Streptomyces sp. SN-593]